jgi:YidC/Oxa1 family membrane protein insertase
MGVTMFVQMRLNPTPPDPTQQMIFTWMPLIFTFMLASFPAGLVIYWAWNNTLSVTQQYVIMRRQGVAVDLLGNIASTFKRPPKSVEAAKPAEKLPVAANDPGSAKPQPRAKAKRAAKAKPSSADA